MVESVNVKCGRCNVALKGPADPKPDDIIACPVCGEADKFETVIEAAKEYIKDMMLKDAKRAFSGMDGVTVKDPGEKTYRFTADF